MKISMSVWLVGSLQDEAAQTAYEFNFTIANNTSIRIYTEKELTTQQLCIGDGTKVSGTIVEISL